MDKHNLKNYIIIVQTVIIFLLLFLHNRKENLALKTVCESKPNLSCESIPKNIQQPSKAIATQNLEKSPATKSVLNPQQLNYVKSIRLEIKNILMSFYTANVAFKAERGRYGANLKALGAFIPKSPMVTKIGFASPYQGRIENSENLDPAEETDFISTDGFVKFKMQDSSLEKNVSSYSKGVCTVFSQVG